MTRADAPVSDIAGIDSLPAPALVEAVAPWFEGAPGFVWRLAASHGTPFGSWSALFSRARLIAHDMPEPLQVDLVDAHPRLGARREALSAMSAREQEAAADDVTTSLDRLNADYEARYGFRYCVFVAGRPLAALLPGLRAALAAERDAELHRALDAVVDIAQARQAAAGALGARPGSAR